MSKGLKKKNHWTSRVHEIVIVRNPEGQLGFELKGGAENGQFPYLGEVKPGKVAYEGGSKLVPEELLLEVNETPVAGLTIRDVLAVIKHCKDPIRLKCVKQGKACTAPQIHPPTPSGGRGRSWGEQLCCCSLTFPLPAGAAPSPPAGGGCERRCAVPAAGRIKCASVTALRHAAGGDGGAAAAPGTPPASPSAGTGRPSGGCCCWRRGRRSGRGGCGAGLALGSWAWGQGLAAAARRVPVASRAALASLKCH